MRLFISINFNELIKNEIISVQNCLKQYARGSFALPENLHLTLVFLGEIAPSDLEKIKITMNKLKVPRMKLIFSHTGHFKGNDGDIWWLGIENNPSLLNLQASLASELINGGFKIESRKYQPHITLARRVKTHKPFSPKDLLAHPFSSDVSSISLMVSQRVAGKLTYTEIYSSVNH